MTNGSIIKKYWLHTLFVLLGSLASFGQTLSDQQIGFDEARATAKLKEYGVKDQDLAREIALMRKMQQRQHTVMKKVEDGIFKKIQAEQKAKMSTSRLGALVIDISQSERNALIALYNSTDGPNWKNTLQNNKPWNINDPTSDVSKWYGIQVYNGRVIFLDLNWNNLTGIIPSEIGNLKNLNFIDLRRNKLTGNIPAEIGNLTNIYFLDFTGNNLSGNIPPEIGNLKKIEMLYLGANQLTGNIPIEISNLTKLQFFQLYSNKLTGSIPVQLQNLIALKVLDLSINQLSSSIPTQLFDLKSLQNLDLTGNTISGSIPPEIGNLTQLVELRLGYNQLTGTIPAQIGNSKYLTGISLRINKLTGFIPKEIFDRTSMDYVDLSYNQLTGSIPAEISTIKTESTFFYFQQNQLTGEIPKVNTLGDFYINFNKYRFKDISDGLVANNILYDRGSAEEFLWYPQLMTDLPEKITVTDGQTVNMIMYTDNRFTPEGISYQWYKNGVAIAGANSRIYTLANATLANAGIYTCNSYSNELKLSSLVLEREPITLIISNCAPTLGKIKFIPKVLAGPSLDRKTTTKTNL
jgi:Leucine-rich repeat (LRR) protein